MLVVTEYVENKALILLALSLIVAVDKLGLSFFFSFT